MHRHNRLFLIALMASALAGCRPGGAPSVVTPTQAAVFSTGSRVNLAQAGRLAGVAALEIARFSAQADANAPYTLVTTIRDRETLDRLVGLLDQELDVGPVPACIADYEQRFRRPDGVVVTFGYLCGPDGAYFISTQSSDQSLSVLGQVKLPDEFRELVSAQLKGGTVTNPPTATPSARPILISADTAVAQAIAAAQAGGPYTRLDGAPTEIRAQLDQTGQPRWIVVLRGRVVETVPASAGGDVPEREEILHQLMIVVDAQTSEASELRAFPPDHEMDASGLPLRSLPAGPVATPPARPAPATEAPLPTSTAAPEFPLT